MELSHTHYGPRTGFPFGSPEHPLPPPLIERIFSFCHLETSCNQQFTLLLLG